MRAAPHERSICAARAHELLGKYVAVVTLEDAAAFLLLSPTSISDGSTMKRSHLGARLHQARLETKRLCGLLSGMWLVVALPDTGKTTACRLINERQEPSSCAVIAHQATRSGHAHLVSPGAQPQLEDEECSSSPTAKLGFSQFALWMVLAETTNTPWAVPGVLRARQHFRTLWRLGCLRSGSTTIAAF